MVLTNAATTTANDEERDQCHEMYALVGEALSQWSDLELKLHLVAFRSWIANDIGHTSEILDAVISFEARMKLIGTIVRQHSPSQDALRLWPFLVAYISKLKRKRDRIAHSIVTRKGTSNLFVLFPFMSFANLDMDGFNGAMTATDLRRCIGHFEEATFVTLEFSWLATGKPIPPEGIHEQAQPRLRELRMKAGLTPQSSSQETQDSDTQK